MDHPFMARAIQLSTDNVHSGGGPSGAVSAKGGAIIANQVTLNNDPTRTRGNASHPRCEA
jgi:tRNA(Arg) A34 adenosine deaminase TadA